MPMSRGTYSNTKMAMPPKAPPPQQAQMAQDAKRRGQQKAVSNLNVDFGKSVTNIPLPPLPPGRRKG